MRLEGSGAVACCWNRLWQDAMDHDLYLNHLQSKVGAIDWFPSQLHQVLYKLTIPGTPESIKTC